MKITAFDPAYTQLLASGGTTLISSTGSNSGYGGDLVGTPGELSVVGLRNVVSLASNMGDSTVGTVLTTIQSSPWVATFAVASNSGASYGSNSTRVSAASAAGAATNSSRSDHLHAGIGTVTASASNTLDRGTLNLRPGSNVSFGLTDSDGSGGFDTLTINSTGGGGGSVSAGSNSTRVSERSLAGVAATFSPSDHQHDGIGTVTASASNTMQRGTLNLRPGAGMALSLTDADGSGDFDTITLVNTGSGGSGGGGSGALVLLEQHTASASATLNFTTAISSTYDEYVLEIVNIIPATNNAKLLLRAGTGAGPTWDSGANYGWLERSMRVGGSDVGTGATSGATGMQVAGVTVGCSSNTAYGVSGSLRLTNPQSASLYKQWYGQTRWYYDTGADPVVSVAMGTYLSTTAITGMQLLFSTGNIASGIVRVYGVAK